ncbi:MAG: hypothetical protein QOE03_3274 [Micromonosporaceae bacterium]|nr:hypothetical protein [Micromonosporaceae bacterium]
MTRGPGAVAIGVAVLLGVTGVLGLTGCGRGSAATSGSAATGTAAAGVAAAGVLATMGFDTGAPPVVESLAEPAGAPSAAPSANPSARNGARRTAPLRKRLVLRKNTLHGEFVVKTKDGTKTVDVQRGTVTAIDERTVSVKSTDGFTLTWTFGSPIRVLEHRTTVQPSAVKVGTEIGVAGTKAGGATTANLIVLG